MPPGIEFCAAGLPWTVEAIGDWGHPRGQRILALTRTATPDGRERGRRRRRVLGGSWKALPDLSPAGSSARASTTSASRPAG